MDEDPEEKSIWEQLDRTGGSAQSEPLLTSLPNSFPASAIRCTLNGQNRDGESKIKILEYISRKPLPIYEGSGTLMLAGSLCDFPHSTSSHPKTIRTLP